MMQKNLSCRNLKDAQKNMLVFSVVLVIVTGLFYVVGNTFFIYAKREGIAIPLMDGTPKQIYSSQKSLNSSLGLGVAITFILGLIAAAYSSADSALILSPLRFVWTFYPWKNDRKRNKKTEKTNPCGHEYPFGFGGNSL